MISKIISVASVLSFTMMLCSILWSTSPPFSRDEFEANLVSRLERVEEFEKIKNLDGSAKIILGGESFGSYANYVFWVNLI